MLTHESHRLEQNQGWYQILILTRRLGEAVKIGDNTKITVEKIGNKEIKIGIEAPKDVVVCREEVLESKVCAKLPDNH